MEFNIKNTKTGNEGKIIETYNRTSDNAKMHKVSTLSGKAYWMDKNCEVA